MSAELVKALGDVAVALSPILVSLIGLLALAIRKKIIKDVDNTLLEKGLLLVSDGVFTVVKEMEQLMAQQLRDASEDGKLDKADAEAIKAAALAKLKSFLSFDEIAKLLGMSDNEAVEAFVGSKLEAAVNDLKAAGRAGPLY